MARMATSDDYSRELFAHQRAERAWLGLSEAEYTKFDNDRTRKTLQRLVAFKRKVEGGGGSGCETRA